MSQPSTHISIAAPNRGFGLGFGAHHQVAVYTGAGPKTGALLTHTQCERIAQWKDSGDSRALTDLIPPQELAGALHNRLLHADTLELLRLLPRMLEQMTPQQCSLLFGEPVSRIDPAVWEECRATRPQLGLTPDNAQAYFRALSEAPADIRAAADNHDFLFNGVSMEAAATIFPALFEALDPESRTIATQAIARALHAAGEDKSFFAPLADPNLNRLVIAEAQTGPCKAILNNGRTFMITSPNGPQLLFQGDRYISRELHFHPLQNADDSPVLNLQGEKDSKPEFMRYRNAAHHAQCLRDRTIDPNRNKVGQLHAIFVAPGKHALLLGADVVLGAPNREFGQYIAFAKAQRNGQPFEIVEDVNDAKEVEAKGIDASSLAFNPLACFGTRFDAPGLPEAPFMSLQLGGAQLDESGNAALQEGKNAVFYRGVRVIHLPEPITISPEQLADLRQLQPVLKSLSEGTCVHPLARFAPAQQHLINQARTESPAATLAA